LYVAVEIVSTASLSVATSVSASYALTSTSSSFAVSSTSASYALNSTSASYAVNSTSASYALNATTASYAQNIGPTLTQNLVLSGSVIGKVSALSISSNTASLDLSTGNFYTLQLVSGSNTFINPSNIQIGQTINILLSTTGSGTVSFPSSVKQVSGSAYVPTTTTSKDIITLISYDATDLYLSNVKNLV
jgi:N-acetylmuramoyl-L-alanine amidase